MSLSVVLPCYKCESKLIELHRRLTLSLSEITDDYEIIFVNDSSPQNDWQIIKKLSEIDSKVRGINFSRNFGQHNAITAGLDFTNGDWVVVMDADLQDQPEEIIKMYNKALEGYDVVFGKRVSRKDNLFKRISSKLFFSVYDYFTDSQSDSSIANFSISKNNVILNFRRLREKNRSFNLFIMWMGFNIGYVNIDHAPNYDRKTAYTLKKLFKLAIENIIAQTNKPLILSVYFGFFTTVISLMISIYLLYRHFILGIHVQGWTSVMLSIWFIGGLLFANMGLTGIYIGKIFDETKNRPLYIIKDSINIH